STGNHAPAMTDQIFSAPEAATPGATTADLAGFWIRFAAALIDGVLLGIASTVLQAALKGAGTGLSLLVGIAYYTYFEGESGQTIGKRAVGIRVVDVDRRGPIGYGRAFIRYVGRFVSGVVLLIGYLWMLWDPKNQT